MKSVIIEDVFKELDDRTDLIMSDHLEEVCFNCVDINFNTLTLHLSVENNCKVSSQTGSISLDKEVLKITGINSVFVFILDHTRH